MPLRAWGSYDILLALCLLSVLALSLVGNPGITGQIPESTFWVGGVLCILTAFRVESYRRFHLSLLLVLILVIWSVISSFFGLDRYVSEQSLTTLVCSTGVLVTSAYLGRRYSWIVWVKLCAVFVILCIVAKSWYLELSLGAESGRFAGYFTNPNTLAVLLLIAVTISFSLPSNGNRGLEAFRLFTITIFSLTILLTLSRSGMAGLVVCMAAGFFAAKRGQGTTSGSGRVAILLLAILGLGVLMSLGFSGPVIERTSSALNNKYDIPVREELVVGSLKCGLENPLLGSGPGTFQLMFQCVRSEDTLVQELANSAHNDSLDYLVELGVPGFVLWIALLSVVLYCTPLKPDFRRVYWLPAGILGVFVFSLFNFVMAVPTTAIWFFFLLGLAISESSARSGLKLEPSAKLLFAAVLIFLGFFALLSSIVRHLSAAELQNSKVAYRERDYARSLEALDRGLEYSANDVRLWTARIRTLDKLDRVAPNTGHAEAAEASIRIATQLSPNNRRVLRTGMKFYLKRDQLDQALAFAERAHQLAPYHYRTRRQLVEVLIERREVSRAVELLLAKPKTRIPLLVSLLMELDEQSPGAALSALGKLDAEGWAVVEKPLRKAALSEKNVALLMGIHNLSVDPAESGFLKKQTRLAGDLLKLGERETALELLRPLVREKNAENDGYADALFLWSEFKEPASLELLQGYLRSNPGNTKIRIAVSEQLDVKDAVDLINEGLANDPRNFDMLHQMGVLFERQGLKEIALGYFNEARKVRK